MTQETQKSNVIPYRKRRNINIGIVIFGIIFVYLIATIVLYLTAPHVTVYEVRQGSILKDNAYTGIAIRSESVVYAEEAGYANYYVENNHKVRVGTNVYSVSNKKLDFQDAAIEEQEMLTDEELRVLLRKVQSYHSQFRESDFSSTYQLKGDLENSLGKYTSQSKQEQLQHMLSSGSHPDLVIKSAMQDGVIVYSVDGMETLTLENITVQQLKKDNYKKTTFSNNRQIKSGDPVYKIVDNDKWDLLIQVSDETRNLLTDKGSVKVHFKKDNQETYGKISFLDNMEESVVCLSFEHSMVRYVNERYLDIELILEDETGLKIPKSSKTTKEFYVVPKSYLTQGGNSSDDGVMVQAKDEEGNAITRFLSTTVYYEDGEVVYLDPNVLGKTKILLKPDSTETFQLNEKCALNGVYCINKGYAVFKQIKILCESDEYYIVEEGNDFGLSNYDHIALEGKSIHENDVVF